MKGVLIAVLVLCAIAFIGATSKNGASPNGPRAVSDTAVPIGQPVSSERFEYTITDYKCGISAIGKGEILREKAKGHFCRLSLKAKNISKKTQRLDFDDFTLVKGDTVYSTDSWVNIKASEGDDTAGFLEDVNPDLVASGNIFFDVPKDVAPTTAKVTETSWDKTLTFTLTK